MNKVIVQMILFYQLMTVRYQDHIVKYYVEWDSLLEEYLMNGFRF